MCQQHNWTFISTCWTKTKGDLRKQERSPSAGGSFQPRASHSTPLCSSLARLHLIRIRAPLLLRISGRINRPCFPLCAPHRTLSGKAALHLRLIFFCAHSHLREAGQNLHCCSLRLEWRRLESTLSANLWDYVQHDRWSSTTGSRR